MKISLQIRRGYQLSEGFNIQTVSVNVSVSQEKIQIRRNYELKEFELSGTNCTQSSATCTFENDVHVWY